MDYTARHNNVANILHEKLALKCSTPLKYPPTTSTIHQRSYRIVWDRGTLIKLSCITALTSYSLRKPTK